MALRKRTATADPRPQHSLDAALLMEAFHYAWEGALQGELITSSNILYAPREMLRAVLVVSETAHAVKSKQLGELALAGWREVYDARAEFAQAVPPTDSIN